MTDAPEQGIAGWRTQSRCCALSCCGYVTPAGSAVQFPVDSMTVELKVVATRSADGRAAFSVPFVNVGLGGSAGWQRETMQTVTVTFGAPVDEAGHPVRVTASSDELKG